jgi:hypothetical protein
VKAMSKEEEEAWIRGLLRMNRELQAASVATCKKCGVRLYPTFESWLYRRKNTHCCE